MLLRYGPVWWGVQQPQNGGIDAIALGLTRRSPSSRGLQSSLVAKLSDGVEVVFRAYQRRQELNEAAIAQLRLIVEGFLTEDEYRCLKNIRKNVEHLVKPGAAASLDAELRHLRALRLIDGSGIRTFSTPDRKKR
jgi:hypothetical protein